MAWINIKFTHRSVCLLQHQSVQGHMSVALQKHSNNHRWWLSPLPVCYLDSSYFHSIF